MSTLIGAVVQLGLTDSPLGSGFYWTDISHRVLKVSSARGGNYESGQVETGAFDATLTNDDGFLDPRNTSSPFYPYVRLRTPVRFGVNVGGVTYWLWRGYARSWSQTWPGGPARSVVQLSAWGVFKVVLDHTLPGGYQAQVYGQSAEYWPLDAGLGETMPRSSNRSNPVVTSGGGATFTFGSPVVTDGGHALQVTTTSTTPTALVNTTYSLSTTVGHSIEWWMRFDAIPAGTRSTIVIANTSSSAGTAREIVAVDNGTGYKLGTRVIGGATVTDLGVPVVIGTAYYMVLRMGEAGVWVNGVLYSTPSAVLVFNQENRFRLLDIGASAGGSFPNGLTVSLDNLSTNALGISQGGIAHNYALGTSATGSRLASLPVQSIHDRIVALGSAAGLAAGQMAVDADSTQVAGVGDVAASPGLTLIRQAGADGGGSVFEDHLGRLAYTSLATTMSTGVVAVLGENENPYQRGIVLDYDDTQVANAVFIDAPALNYQGSTYVSVAENPQSQGIHGVIGFGTTTGLVNPADIDTLANVLVNRKAFASTRVATAVVSSTSKNFATQFTVEVGDLVWVWRRSYPVSGYLICRVQKISHQMDRPGEVRTSFELAPFVDGYGAWDDPNLGIWDDSLTWA